MSKKSFVGSVFTLGAVLLSTVGASSPVIVDDRYAHVLSESSIEQQLLSSTDYAEASLSRDVSMFSSSANTESMIVNMLTGNEVVLLSSENAVVDGDGSDGMVVRNLKSDASDYFTNRIDVSSAKFSGEMLEENLDAERDDLVSLQEEWEEEQEREEAEARAEREAETERLVEAAVERHAEREAELALEREEAEREEQEREERERRERENASGSDDSSSGSDSSANASRGSEGDAGQSEGSRGGSESSSFSRGSASDGCGGWGELVEEYFGEREYDKACSVLVCESEGNPTAQNPTSTASGLWQFLDTTWGPISRNVDGAGEHDRAMHATPEQQTEGAKLLRDTYGWSQWVCQ